MAREQIIVLPSHADGKDFVDLYKQGNQSFPILLVGHGEFLLNFQGKQRIGSCSNIDSDKLDSKVLGDVDIKDRNSYGLLMCFPDSQVPAVFIRKKPEESQGSEGKSKYGDVDR